MVTRVQHVVIDDLDGSDGAVSTYRFAFNGAEYEIDLGDDNFDKLADALRPFLAVARRLPKRTPPATGSGSSRHREPSAVRRWWQEHQSALNLPVFQPRGGIPHQVRDAFHAAHRPR